MGELKDRLKLALATRNMTAADLSRKSGIDKGSISKYLKGTFTPKQNAIGSMARALNVSPAWLLGFDVPMEPTNILVETLDMKKLTEANRKRLESYYQALLDTQEDNK